MRPSTQSVEAVNDILENHLSGLERKEYGLFILQEDKIRKLDQFDLLFYNFSVILGVYR